MKEKKESTNSVSSEKIKAALIKKALGYDATEVVEEYVGDEDGEVKLAKKKITKKNVPPDITALKILIDEEESVSDMTDEELETEKERLLKILAESVKKEKRGEENCIRISKTEDRQKPKTKNLQKK